MKDIWNEYIQELYNSSKKWDSLYISDKEEYDEENKCLFILKGECSNMTET